MKKTTNQEINEEFKKLLKLFLQENSLKIYKSENKNSEYLYIMKNSIGKLQQYDISILDNLEINEISKTKVSSYIMGHHAINFVNYAVKNTKNAFDFLYFASRMIEPEQIIQAIKNNKELFFQIMTEPLHPHRKNWSQNKNCIDALKIGIDLCDNKEEKTAFLINAIRVNKSYLNSPEMRVLLAPLIEQHLENKYLNEIEKYVPGINANPQNKELIIFREVKTYNLEIKKTTLYEQIKLGSSINSNDYLDMLKNLEKLLKLEQLKTYWGIDNFVLYKKGFNDETYQMAMIVQKNSKLDLIGVNGFMHYYFSQYNQAPKNKGFNGLKDFMTKSFKKYEFKDKLESELSPASLDKQPKNLKI